MARLRHDGGRSTTSRRAVLVALMELGEGKATAEEVTGTAQSSCPEITASTVYRTLERFERLGIAYHVHLGHGPSVWHLTEQPRRYLICNSCGEVEGVLAELLGPLETRVQELTGFEIDRGHFALTGTCARCAARGRER